MRIRNQIVYVFLTLLAFACPILAQNSASSPYSLFGLGELSASTPTAYRSMGGVSVGMRSNKAINPDQPASYTACDSLTFMFDIAAGVSWSRYKDALGQRNRANGNLEYVTLQLPLYRRYIAASVGVLPFSESGYSFSQKDTSSLEGHDYPNTRTYSGAGSISQIYGGLSFNILDWVAVGANFYYVFGEISRNKILQFTGAPTTVSQGEYIRPSSFRYRTGLQLFHEFEHHSFVAGATFESQMPLKGTSYVYETSTEFGFDTIRNTFDLPMQFGVGISYTWEKKLTVALDYTYQQWASARYYGLTGGETGDYRNRQHMALGVQYCDNAYARNYAQRMLWRAGIQAGSSYVSAVRGPEITAAIGVGFPLRTSGTQVNTTIEYTHRGAKGQLQDNTLKLTIGVSVCENWFFKRRI